MSHSCPPLGVRVWLRRRGRVFHRQHARAERADREPRHHDVPVAGQHERQRHRQHGGADGHEPVGPPAQLHGHEGEEHRGEREVQAVPLRTLDEAAERGADRDAADERARDGSAAAISGAFDRDAADERARDGGGAAEIDPRVRGPRARDGDRERLVVDEVGDEREPEPAKAAERRRERGRHQIVPHVDHVGGDDDRECRRAGGDHGHGHELRGAREDQHRHAEHLGGREPRLDGEAAEDAAVDEDRRDERQRGDETVAQAARQAEPRQKNARSTNRTTPTSRIASEELQIMRRSQRVSRTSTSAGTATATTSAWPISTPALNPKSESRSPCEDSPSSRSAAEKPKPWTRPKQKLTSQRRATTGLNNRFSAATNAIDSAMTASTRRSGSTTMSSAARPSVTLWASVNAVMILASANQPPPRRRRPSRNSRWSQPVRMCPIPSRAKLAKPRWPPDASSSLTRVSRVSGVKANCVVRPGASMRASVW